MHKKASRVNAIDRQPRDITFADQKLTDPNAQITIDQEAVLKVGKRRVCKVAKG